MKYFFKTLLAIIIASLLIIVTGYYYLASNGDKKLVFILKPIINFALSGKHYKFYANNLLLKKFDNKERLIISDIHIFNQSKEIEKNDISEIIIDFQFNQLFNNQPIAMDIQVNEAKFNFALNDKKSLEINDIAADIVKLFSYKKISINEIRLNKHLVNLKKDNIETEFQIDQAIIFKINQHNYKANINYNINNNYFSTNMSLNLDDEQNLTLRNEFIDFPVNIVLSDEHIFNKNHLAIDFTLSAIFSYNYNLNTNISKSHLTITSCNGELSSKDLNIPIKSLTGNINWTDLNQLINYSNFKLILADDIKIDLAAQQDFLLMKKYPFKLNLKTDYLPLDFIYQFNNKLNNKIISYLENTIKNGVIKNVNLDLQLPKNFLETKTLDHNSLSGDFFITADSYSYLDKLPKLKNVEAKAHLANNKLILTNKKLDFLNHDFTDIVYEIPLYDFDNSQMLLTGKATGKALNLLEFIPKNKLDNLIKKNIAFAYFKGEAVTDIKIAIPYDRKKQKITYDITSEIKDFAAKFVADKFLVKSNDLKAKFDGAKITVSGPAKINNINSEINYQFNLDDELKYNNDLNFKLYFAKDYNIPAIKLNNDKLEIRGEVKFKDDQGYYKLTSDLTKVDFTAPHLFFTKKQGRAAKLEVESSLKENAPIKCNINGDNIDVEASLKLVNDNIAFDANKLNFDSTKAKLIYQQTANSEKIDFKANFLDCSDFKLKMDAKKSAKQISYKNIEIDKILFANDIKFRDLVFTSNCIGANCLSGHLQMKYLNNDQLSGYYETREDKPFWQIEATNAGYLFNAFNFNKVRKGYLTAKIFDDINYHGELKLSKFDTIDMPVISKIISFASIEGLLNVTSNTIPFKKFDMNFEYQDNILKIIKGRAEGNYFDFSVMGKVDFNQQKVKLKGGVTPDIIGLSRIMKNIPLLGEAYKHAAIIPYSVSYKFAE